MNPVHPDWLNDPILDLEWTERYKRVRNNKSKGGKGKSDWMEMEESIMKLSGRVHSFSLCLHVFVRGTE